MTILCPLCGASETKEYMKGIFDCEVTTVRECGACHVQFLDPLMTNDEEGVYYENYYRMQINRNVNASSLEMVHRKAYLDHMHRLQHVRSYIAQTSKILDVGSGSGALISLLQDQCTIQNIQCVERSLPNREFIKKKCNGVVVHLSLEEVSDRDFDVIFGIAVFEHIKQPKIFLQQCYNLLRDDGVVILEMPNKDDAVVTLYELEEYKKFIYQKQHCYTYSEESLRHLINETNFSIEKIYYAQAYGIDNHISWLRYRKPRDYSYLSKMITEEVKETYEKMLVKNKQTDVLGIVLKKEKR